MPDLRELCAPPAPDLAGLPVFDLMFEDDDWLDVGPFPLLSTPFFTVDDMMSDGLFMSDWVPPSSL